MNKKLVKEIKRIFLESGKAYMFGCSIYSEDELNKMIKDIANLKLDYERERIIGIVKKITIKYLGCEYLNKTAEKYFKEIATKIIGDDNND